jgi:hypothetical protein
VILPKHVTKDAPRLGPELYEKFPGDQKLEHAAGLVGRNMDHQLRPRQK